jgi:hypothetical protein
MNARSSMGRGGLLAMVFGLALAACGGPLQYEAKGTPRAPEADATIIADINSQAVMTRVTVTAQHLAPPDRLLPGGASYVVWARKDSGAQWQRIGALVYSADSRKGTMEEASVPLSSFELIITAEQQSAPASPSPHVAIQQKIAN